MSYNPPGGTATQDRFGTGVRPPGPGTEVELWNPSAAANWSILLTPAFGAYIHAANWRRLGNPERARANAGFFWFYIVFAAVDLLAVLRPSLAIPDQLGMPLGLVLLIWWNFGFARSQITYVKDNFGKNYPTKSLGVPVLVGFGGIVGYIALIIGLLTAFPPKPSIASLTETVKESMLTKFHETAGGADALIQNITLSESGADHYVGTVDLTAGGHSEHHSFDATYDSGKISWKIVE